MATDLKKMMSIFQEIASEREDQDEEWGPEHDDKHNALEWVGLITAYLGDSLIGKAKSLSRIRLIQVAALVVAAIEAIDRQNRGGIVMGE